jgi:hypothetical protein
MPTAYTEELGNGQWFQDFVLCCANHFLPLGDAPTISSYIPEFTPSKYHEQQIPICEEWLSFFLSTSDSELQDVIDREMQEDLKYYGAQVAKMNSLKMAHYEMRNKVLAWIPPTKEHKKLQEFMLNQLSISHEDIYVPKYPDRLPVDAYRNKMIKFYTEELTYHKVEHEKEIKEAARNNEWVTQLLGSLKGGDNAQSI